MKKSLLFLVLLVASPAFAGGGSSVGLGNPASANCLKLGGKLETYITPAGEASNCVIDEWKLFDEMNKLGLIKPHHYGSNGMIGMPNPAAVNCDDIGGALREVETPAGTAGFCVVDQWALYNVINVTSNH